MYKPKGSCNDQLALESKLMKNKKVILGADQGDTIAKEIAKPPAHEK
jgi:hypothetical protein